MKYLAFAGGFILIVGSITALVNNSDKAQVIGNALGLTGMIGFLLICAAIVLEWRNKSGRGTV